MSCWTGRLAFWKMRSTVCNKKVQRNLDIYGGVPAICPMLNKKIKK